MLKSGEASLVFTTKPAKNKRKRMEMSWSNGRNAWSKGRHSNMKKVSCTKATTGGVL